MHNFQFNKIVKKNKKTTWKTPIMLIIGVILLLIISTTAYNYNYKQALQNIIVVNGSQTITITTGQSVNQIAKLLKEQHLISSTWAFTKYINDSKLSSKLQAGKFILRGKLKITDLATILQTAQAQQFTIQIKAGLSLKEIAQQLDKKGILSSIEIFKCVQQCDFKSFNYIPKAGNTNRLEGFLFPDTYFFNAKNFTADKFLTRLIIEFHARIVKKYSPHQTPSTIRTNVNLAAMIEKESRASLTEKSMIADIIKRRLARGMPLGIDATLRYALGKYHGQLNLDDLKLNSPYNTRKYTGLPPSAISNFSEQSYQAAINPKKNNYWYYLHDNKGRIHYARTLAGHNANKRRYLR